jgi:hypothetical protein
MSLNRMHLLVILFTSTHPCPTPSPHARSSLCYPSFPRSHSPTRSPRVHSPDLHIYKQRMELLENGNLCLFDANRNGKIPSVCICILCYVYGDIRTYFYIYIIYAAVSNGKRKPRRFSLLRLPSAHHANRSLLFVRLLTKKQTEVCGEPAISLQSHHVSLVQWTTCLLPVTRDPGLNPQWGTSVKTGFSC